MGARSGIYEAVAAMPVRKTMFFAAALLGLLVIFGASGDTAFAKGKPVEFIAGGSIVHLTNGDVSPAGGSERFVVKNRVATGGIASAVPELNGAFSFTFGTNVPIESQSGQIHGTLATSSGVEAKVVAKSGFGEVPGGTYLVDFGFVAIVPLHVTGKLTFTSVLQGNGSIEGLIWAIVDKNGSELDGHIVGVADVGIEYPNVLGGTTTTTGSGVVIQGVAH